VRAARTVRVARTVETEEREPPDLALHDIFRLAALAVDVFVA